MEEFKIIKTWEYRGRKCLILWIRTHYCGYAETSLRDIDVDINVHGGITFSGRHDKLPENPFDLDIWYYGFDCAHYDDFLDYKKLGVEIPNSLQEGQHKWTEEEVVVETEHLVDEILVYENEIKENLENTKTTKEDVKIASIIKHESFIEVKATCGGFKYSGILLKGEMEKEKC